MNSSGNKLHIIGNGFDLYHGLPCSYYYFACFLVKNYPLFYEEMSKMYDFSCYKEVDERGKFEFYVERMFWKEFEQKLGELNSSWLEYSLMDNLGLECDDPVDLPIPEVANAGKIRRLFCEWMQSTVNTKSNFKLIKRLMRANKCNVGKEDFYLNFNYTQTLQEIYEIPEENVFHIHGQCYFDGNCEELIVGHGNTEVISELEKEIARIEQEKYYLSQQFDRNRLTEYKSEHTVLSNLQKNVNVHLHCMEEELNDKHLDIEEIKVWGLSCGDIDKPYIEYLTSRFPKAKWKFSYYDYKEKINRKKLAEEMGLLSEEVDFFELKNLNSDLICDRLVRDNDIVQF